MAQDYITAPTAATPSESGRTGRLSPEMQKLITRVAKRFAPLSQSELFRRYLDAPVRDGSTTSALVWDEGKMHDTTARNRFLYYGYCGYIDESIHNNFAEDVLEHVESDEFPSFELDKMIGELSGLVEALRVLKLDFDRLAEVTRTPEPDEDALDEDYRDWEENPRYVLPPAPSQTEAA